MNNQAAQTMPTVPQAFFDEFGVNADDRVMDYGRACYAAALSQTAGVAEGKRDREADRLRFPDDDFNAWLDVGISDAGHTVYDSLSSIEDAWQGWHGHVLSLMSDENPVFDDLAIDSPTTAASVSERARELLAAEFEKDGLHDMATAIRAGHPNWELSLRAIEQAMTQQRGDEPAAWMVEWTDNAGDPTRYIAYCEEDAADKLGVLSDGEAATAKVVPLYTTPHPSADAVRELAATWRKRAERKRFVGLKNEALLDEAHADELESLLSAANDHQQNAAQGGGEK